MVAAGRRGIGLMHMMTDHSESTTLLFCDHCIVTETVSVFSPRFVEMLGAFTTLHAPCAAGGEPDMTDIQKDSQDRAAAARRLGFERIHGRMGHIDRPRIRSTG